MKLLYSWLLFQVPLVSIETITRAFDSFWDGISWGVVARSVLSEIVWLIQKKQNVVGNYNWKLSLKIEIGDYDWELWLEIIIGNYDRKLWLEIMILNYIWRLGLEIIIGDYDWKSWLEIIIRNHDWKSWLKIRIRKFDWTRFILGNWMTDSENRYPRNQLSMLTKPASYRTMASFNLHN